MKKLSLALIYGGKSSEHEISKVSASTVLHALDKNRYNITVFFIDKAGRWFNTPLDDALAYEGASLPDSVPSSKPASLSAALFEGIDVVLPIMHGQMYEDGALSGFLRLCEKPFAGPDVLGAAVAMDKAMAKIIVQSGGVEVVPSCLLLKEEAPQVKNEKVAAFLGQYKFPLFVKAASLGSSIATYKVSTQDELEAAIDKAFTFDSRVLVEQYIDAREIELAVMDSPNGPIVSTAGEILFEDADFYTYEAKYQNDDALTLEVPADVSKETLQRLQQLAKIAFVALACRGYARVDFFISKKSGNIYFNELNTLPGFTAVSMFPLLWRHEGMGISAVLDNLIEAALCAYEKSLQLKIEGREC